MTPAAPKSIATSLPAPNKAPCSKIAGRDPSGLPLLLTPAAEALLTPEVAALLTPVAPAAPGASAPALALDLDITNGGGPCAIIDATRVQAASTSFQAAVCLTNNPGGVPVAAFGYRVLYNDTLIAAPGTSWSGLSGASPPSEYPVT